MGLTLAEYDEVPVIERDWDLAMHKIEQDVEAEKQRKAAQ